jgi:hypothetical protein
VASELLPNALTKLEGEKHEQVWILGDAVADEVSALAVAGQVAQTHEGAACWHAVHLLVCDEACAAELTTPKNHDITILRSVDLTVSGTIFTLFQSRGRSGSALGVNANISTQSHRLDWAATSEVPLQRLMRRVRNPPDTLAIGWRVECRSKSTPACTSQAVSKLAFAEESQGNQEFGFGLSDSPALSAITFKLSVSQRTVRQKNAQRSKGFAGSTSALRCPRTPCDILRMARFSPDLWTEVTTIRTETLASSYG